MPKDQKYAAVSDDVLIEQIAQKDHGAFGQLTGRYMKLIYHAAYRLGANREQAEDIAQDALLRVWQKAGLYDPEKGASVRTWIYRITYNLAVDAKRKERQTVDIEEQNLPMDGKTDQPLQDKQRAQLVRRAINALPDRQRVALVLCHYKGLSNAEAADVMGATVKAVEGLLVRARKTLYEELKAQKGVL